MSDWGYSDELEVEDVEEVEQEELGADDQVEPDPVEQLVDEVDQQVDQVVQPTAPVARRSASGRVLPPETPASSAVTEQKPERSGWYFVGGLTAGFGFGFLTAWLMGRKS